MNAFKKNTQIWLLIMGLLVLGAGFSSCKSKKKIAEEQAAIELASKIEQSKTQLNDLLRDDNPKSLDEKQAELDAIIALQLRDPEVETLIEQVQNKLDEERAVWRQEQTEAEKRAREEAERAKNNQVNANINTHFASVASAGSDEQADLRIQRALSLYASKDVPVLIVIAKYGNNQKDYDRPTTIEKYLYYLKDIKKYDKQVEAVKYNDFGKITELELIKR